MTQLRQRESELAEAKVQVAVVTFQTGPVAEAYVQQTGLTWPLLLDPDRELYRAYGMDRARWQDLWGFSTWWVYFKLMARGRRPRWTQADIAQRGGDVLIDPEGYVRWRHTGRGPADRPSVDAILARVGSA